MEPDHKHYARMRAMRKQGISLQETAAAFGITDSRVSQILGRRSGISMSPGPSRLTTPAQDRRMLDLYQSGLTLREISARFEVSLHTVRERLAESGQYRPRRFRGGRRKNPEVEVPKWVPELLQPRYAHLVINHDEHVAASCIRVAKRLGVSA